MGGEEGGGTQGRGREPHFQLRNAQSDILTESLIFFTFLSAQQDGGTICSQFPCKFFGLGFLREMRLEAWI